jgi:hypothetical protein
VCVNERAGIVGSDKVDASFAQLGVADLLHHEIASETARRLDNDRPHTVTLDPLKHGGEAGAHIDGISTAHGRVVELIDQLVPRPLGECLDCRPLALVAVLVGPDVGGRRGSEGVIAGVFSLAAIILFHIGVSMSSRNHDAAPGPSGTR